MTDFSVQSTGANAPLGRFGVFLGFVLLFACVALKGAEADQSQVKLLPKLAAATDGVSVSGISSGAYMAGQFQMAHANKVVGAAIIAGGPYGCAQSAYSAFTFGFGTPLLNISKAVNGCMLNLYAIWGVPNAERLARKAEALAERSQIDPIASVRTDKIYLFSGTEDRTVVPAIVRAAGRYFQALGVPSHNIKHVTKYPAGHGFVTEDSGPACELSVQPFVVDCDYDQAGDLLAHIYGPLQPRSVTPTGHYLVFDQRPYFGDGPHGLSDAGQVYVPQSCAREAGCRIHIAFHGCSQNRRQVGKAFVEGSGFARWADGNRLIVLFPQVTSSLGNSQACWDWWGYTGSNFLTREAAQIAAVNRMIEQLVAIP